MSHSIARIVTEASAGAGEVVLELHCRGSQLLTAAMLACYKCIAHGLPLHALQLACGLLDGVVVSLMQSHK